MIRFEPKFLMGRNLTGMASTVCKGKPTLTMVNVVVMVLLALTRCDWLDDVKQYCSFLSSA